MSDTSRKQFDTPDSPGAIRRRKRQRFDRFFAIFCIIAAASSIVILITLLTSIFTQGIANVGWTLLTESPSRNAEEAGIYPAMWGTISICFVCAMSAIPLGVGTAILLEEFKPKNRILRKFHGFVQLNITNLAGVPSVVYGILGLTAFVSMFSLFGNANQSSMAIGESWQDYFVTAGGTSIYLPVDGRDAPPTEPDADLPFTDREGNPFTVTIADGATLDPQVVAIEEAAEFLEDDITDALEDDMSSADIRGVVTDLVTEADLSSDKAALIDTLTASLTEAYQEEPGRDRRRAVRRALSPIESIERTARFAGVLSSEAEPNRTSTKSWYYLRLPFGRGVLAGGLTLMLVVLPVIIIASQEAFRAVPDSLRQGSLALGSTKWQTVWNMTLPAAIPGIMTGSILAMSRAIGEAAPILIIAGVVYITFTPAHLMDDFTAMPLQIYDWASRPQEEFHRVAAGGIIILLAILLVFNASAVYIRNKFSKPMQ